jgi:hypothetical protein
LVELGLSLTPNVLFTGGPLTPLKVELILAALIIVLGVLVITFG